MNQHLQTILDFIQNSEKLSPEEKKAFLNSLKTVDKELEITAFKLDRTEKVKRTTAILLEETIEELEQKRKAVEAQNRKLEIEAALERVRFKALGMTKPEDMVDICQVISMELESLNVKNIRNVQTAIFYPEKGTYFNYEYYTRHDKGLVTEVDYRTHELQVLFANQMQQGAGELFTYPLKDKELKDWYDYQKTTNQFVDVYLETTNSLTYYWYSLGPVALGISTYSPMNEAEIELFKNFRNVFDLAYRRFIDIELAIFQAREAKIETALERVRSRTLAMQKSDELSETAAVLFQQLILLGIEPNRLYITIIKDDQANAEFWITDEDGSKVSSAYETNLNNNPVFKKMLAGWKEKKNSLIIDIEGEDLQEYFHYLSSINVPFKGGLSQTRRIQYLGYFDKGFIGMASPFEQSEEAIQLLVRFAAVFNLTFTRFNDLKIAEAHAIQAEEDLVKLQTEKLRAEEALAELQVTQKQLIQSEKMASLGELTAGIAHEIQNPLNFVNNFSEVSIEMIDELKQESVVGGQQPAVSSQQSAIEILDDIKKNLEKILFHGKRADAIVKGMLQHSRTSSGQKEPTDINALADEYLRLAYHGLRAKDKSFNADFKSEFDETLPKINIIPQEIGRVLLNLINNAFYAVNARRLEGLEETQNIASPPEYRPTVIVSTRKSGGYAEIRVKDNGNGIPANILDKIFQPFFTTKPTGQGTGLGLSLSFDIVKAHGGELKVTTRVGEGTEFIILIPAIE